MRRRTARMVLSCKELRGNRHYAAEYGQVQIVWIFPCTRTLIPLPNGWNFVRQLFFTSFKRLEIYLTVRFGWVIISRLTKEHRLRDE